MSSKSTMGSSPNIEAKKMFLCFFIVEEQQSISYKHPAEYKDDAELMQYKKFCFPYNKQNDIGIGHRHQHFTFMLTDLEKRHKYGFCKLVDGGKQCYCFVSVLPWFEIFYKILNCVRTIHSREDTDTLQSLLDKIYRLEIPKPGEIVNVTTSLTFSIPNEKVLPAIPENRNLMEYISAMSPKNMLEIFAALMFERRVIFTSSSLSILTGCVFAAESLLFPLTWQHIFIPILPPHIIDYCLAPMPFLVGLHSSLLASVEKNAVADGVVIVNVDAKTVDTPYDDLEDMPSEAVSYLKSHLNKPNIAVGTNLSETFLKTQARLIGGYRNALKFRMGESITFDEEKFIEYHKHKSRRNFAECLVQLQTFRQFVDDRMDMLNDGIGFRDPFEDEVTMLQRYEGENENAMYKEWLAVTRKGNELIYNVKKQAKTNMKQARESARQSMRDVKHALGNEKDKEQRRQSTLKHQLSLRENIRSARPPRPPPPTTISERRSPSQSPKEGHRPTRPPPPKPVRRYNLLNTDLTTSPTLGEIPETNSQKENSISQDKTQTEGLLVDLSDSHDDPASNELDSFFTDSVWNTTTSNNKPSPTPRTFSEELLNFANIDDMNVLPTRRSSTIRRAEYVKTRPWSTLSYKNNNQDNMLDLFSNGNTSTNNTFSNNNWEQFSSHETTSQNQENSNQTKPDIEGPLISF